ncbi:hypothetical protein ABW19_dt0202451 [Dactylella cylindrospora]|nr:hypothetical protein ABW19_dt0202451 [Dactylella cylindrospora]
MSPKKPTPILLLKTKSSPKDPYEELFSSSGDFKPIFVPVLQHRYIQQDEVKGYILQNEVANAQAIRYGEESTSRFGGLIITSQRAVEALAAVLEDLKESNPDAVATFLSQTLIYVVGPATRNALVNLGFSAMNVVGEESGNGASLADYIIDDYNSTKDLLFLVGETHGTVIPHRLRDKEPRVDVEELVVYKTGTRDEFEAEFRSVLSGLDEETAKEEEVEGQVEERWVVIFSPAGTDAALRVIAEKEKEVKNVKYKVCTIGPTTKDYMREAFKRTPDAMAKSPSPEGLLEGITKKIRVVEEVVV